jgi:hypothetical protein
VRHDSHANASPRQPGRRPPRPELGRPSLFADFDQDSVEDVDPQRIRLLSTLESQRGVRGRPRAKRLPTGRSHPWLTRALMALMAMGMLVMLLSFIQLLRRPPPPLPSAQAALTPPQQAAAERIARTPAAPTAPSSDEAAEIIDLSPPAAGMSPATPPTPSATVAQASPEPPVPMRPAPSATAETERPARPAKAAAPRTNAKREAGASHDDVALVEAMLAHAGPRQAPPTPTAMLQQCGSGASAETAVCRARICVKHPSLAACHTPLAP